LRLLERIILLLRIYWQEVPFHFPKGKISSKFYYLILWLVKGRGTHYYNLAIGLLVRNPRKKEVGSTRNFFKVRKVVLII